MLRIEANNLHMKPYISFPVIRAARATQSTMNQLDRYQKGELVVNNILAKMESKRIKETFQEKVDYETFLKQRREDEIDLCLRTKSNFKRAFQKAKLPLKYA